MTKNIAWCLMAALALAACRNKDFQTLPDGVNAVNVTRASDWWMVNSSDKWVVTVKNNHGSASDAMFAANDYQRSNIYITPSNQLVIIEQGGDDVFFALSKYNAPKALTGSKYGERDTQSSDWRYVGVIRGGALIPPTQAPECIALLGVGSSPYRKQYQVPSFC